ncbi:thiamine-phosphate kinase [uncultured Campylobacter sp.]|uniref:thiamine-phosphate kinase n=1 Tax=uncultured Campylobacter sp. TaxID=218934 RepID=UPI00260969BD|nr:thiamine-phosphate kinase [uncultured Campylobacter sp.]
MDKESFIISAFLNNKINGDDGAIFGDWCFSKDLFFEDVHFKKKWLSLDQIAQKAMLVNISDSIVMNAEPKFALLGLSLPSDLSFGDIKALQNGFLKIAKEFNIQIIGGDTINSDKITISISLISKIRKKAIYRKGLKQGMFLAYTGILGQSLKGLKNLQAGLKLHKNHRFVKPLLRANFFYEASPNIICAMDISDGLKKDMSRMLSLNILDIKPLKKLNKIELLSGEEYEILFAFLPKYKKKIENLAKKHRIKINIFAKTKRGRYKFYGREHHF